MENACGLLPLTFAKNRHGMSIKLIVPWTLRTATLPGDREAGNGTTPGATVAKTLALGESMRTRRNAMIHGHRGN